MDWTHLLVACPERRQHIKHTLDKIERNLEATLHSDDTRVRKTAANVLGLLRDLRTEGDSNGITRYLFGICCRNTTMGNSVQGPLRFIPVLQEVVQVTAAAINELRAAWFDAKASLCDVDVLD